MGTRSLTIVKDEGGRRVVCMYRQMDGYPSVHGLELAEFLAGVPMVNGLRLKTVDDELVYEACFNGPGCMAAAIVAHFKDGPGSIYLEAPSISDYGWCEYVYTVQTGGAGLPIAFSCHTVRGGGERLGSRLFDGTVDAAVAWCKEQQ